MYLVSACLCGVNCKYNGHNNINEDCLELLRSNKAVLICPEQLGGLTTPREASEIIDTLEGKVISKSGVDVSENFKKGAKEALRIAEEANITKAILKEGSPSCGCNYIYDGSFLGKKIEGEGITCRTLRKAGISVISGEEYSKIIRKDDK